MAPPSGALDQAGTGNVPDRARVHSEADELSVREAAIRGLYHSRRRQRFICFVFFDGDRDPDDQFLRAFRRHEYRDARGFAGRP